MKRFRKKAGKAGVVPVSPPAPDRGTSAYIPGLGVGFGAGSPQNQVANPQRFGK